MSDSFPATVITRNCHFCRTRGPDELMTLILRRSSSSSSSSSYHLILCSPAFHPFCCCCGFSFLLKYFDFDFNFCFSADSTSRHESSSPFYHGSWLVSFVMSTSSSFFQSRLKNLVVRDIGSSGLCMRDS